ncbi:MULTISPECIES: beta-1,6-N-acetylglucosaminyltransferase [unclassified Yoonia]|uniref:DUF5927 domain-containing protein n=1 Tax=unclassified Yoonia TaxID=2629118 RepID=UPI002AFF53D2|nr:MULTISPECIES: beta-1,6-N-acetylglucosaminyltransferase [unclassified Yoonia]
MTLGVVMLVHTAFDRAEQMIRHWADAGCPVVVHVDRNVAQAAYDAFVGAVGDLADVSFSRRYRGEWGMWGLIAASKAASRQLLDRYPEIRHVYLASGACLPLRPIAELQAYLDARPDTDFIESVTTSDVKWTIGGLDRERFTLRFPFSWKRQRRLFDGYVRLQQVLRLRRKVPEGLTPHLGSQWWCLTRQTLTAILGDPRRAEFDSYFRQVWIPDESYYQTLVRRHARRLESRSLTLAKFDYQGKPHIFYDDHAELLARSGCFVARKIWPQADGLYQRFPRRPNLAESAEEPRTGTVDRIFAQAVDRRTIGRRGLYMQGRFPFMERENGFTAAPYTVLQGFDDIIPDLAGWLTAQTGVVAHGHLFATDKAHFAGGGATYRGGLSGHARLRDYNAKMFLTNLIWNGRDQHQCFQFGPTDNQAIKWMLTKDTQASVWVVTGAWALSLFRTGKAATDVRSQAARLQQVENRFLKALGSPDARSRRHIMTLAEFLESPVDVLQGIMDDMVGHRARTLKVLPAMVDLDGFPAFLQELKNQGMHPYLTGEFAPAQKVQSSRRQPRKPYLIGKK